MTNEAILIELGINGGKPIRRNVIDATGIPKYTLMKLSGASVNYITTSSLDSVPWGGIATAEKVASDGSSTLAVYTEGVWELKATANAGTIIPGSAVALSGNNTIRLGVEADYPLGNIIGYAEEPISSNAAGRVRLRGN